MHFVTGIKCCKDESRKCWASCHSSKVRDSEKVFIRCHCWPIQQCHGAFFVVNQTLSLIAHACHPIHPCLSTSYVEGRQVSLTIIWGCDFCLRGLLSRISSLHCFAWGHSHKRREHDKHHRVVWAECMDRAWSRLECSNDRTPPRAGSCMWSCPLLGFWIFHYCLRPCLFTFPGVPYLFCEVLFIPHCASIQFQLGCKPIYTKLQRIWLQN